MAVGVSNLDFAIHRLDSNLGLVAPNEKLSGCEDQSVENDVYVKLH